MFFPSWEQLSRENFISKKKSSVQGKEKIVEQNYFEQIYHDRNDWLKNHYRFLGGSSAGVLLGVNKYRSVLQLFNEITNPVTSDEVEDNKNTIQQFGIDSEPLIRQTFALNFPDYDVIEPNGYHSYLRKDKPYLGATIDGLAINKKTGEKTILEIKTRDIRCKADLDEWAHQIPQTYYAQVIHYLMVMNDVKAVKVVAQLRYFDFDQEDSDQVKELRTRFYHIERSEKEEDIKALEKIETEFWENHVKTRIPPNFSRKAKLNE